MLYVSAYGIIILMNANKYPNKTKLIFFFLKGALHYFVLSAFFAALVSLLDMLRPKIISFTVDCVIGNDAPQISRLSMELLDMAGGVSALKEMPLLIALLVALVGALAALCRYLFRVCNARGAETFVQKMRNDLFGHILYLPYTWLSENATGDIIQRCTSDVQTIKRFMAEQMTALVRTFILIFMALWFMSGISPRITLICSLFIPVIVCYSLIFHVKIGSAFEKADIEEGVLSTIAQENLTGVRIVRAFGREVYERERFEKQNEEYTGFWIHLIRLLSAYWASGDIITGLQNLTVLVLGTTACVSGTLSPGNLIALISYNAMLIWPVRTLGRVISEMSKAGISLERLRYIMNSEIEDQKEDGKTPDLSGDIVFENVSFSYGALRQEASPSGQESPSEDRNLPGNGILSDPVPVLKDVSFRIRAGQTVGILGGTGSGKSTLMYLLERLYDLPPENGRITISGVDLREIRTDHLRENIGIVLQEPFLFSMSLSDNISIAAREKTEVSSIREAARIACIDDVIESFTSGYDTFVGERGMTLSGGQKQRTAIAQMLIRKTPIMIFDDSLSAVDAETDARIRKALRENTGGSTVILISHRITTLMHADQILVLEQGRVREAGSHSELLRKGGIYRRIYDLQSAGAHTKAGPSGSGEEEST